MCLSKPIMFILFLNDEKQFIISLFNEFHILTDLLLIIFVIVLFEMLKSLFRSIFNILSSSNYNLKYSNLSLYYLYLIFDEFVYPTHLVINLCTLSQFF